MRFENWRPSTAIRPSASPPLAPAHSRPQTAAVSGPVQRRPRTTLALYTYRRQDVPPEQATSRRTPRRPVDLPYYIDPGIDFDTDKPIDILVTSFSESALEAASNPMCVVRTIDGGSMPAPPLSRGFMPLQLSASRKHRVPQVTPRDGGFSLPSAKEPHRNSLFRVERRLTSTGSQSPAPPKPDASGTMFGACMIQSGGYFSPRVHERSPMRERRTKLWTSPAPRQAGVQPRMQPRQTGNMRGVTRPAKTAGPRPANPSGRKKAEDYLEIRELIDEFECESTTLSEYPSPRSSTASAGPKSAGRGTSSKERPTSTHSRVRAQSATIMNRALVDEYISTLTFRPVSSARGRLVAGMPGLSSRGA
ncbi:hypothetical protein GMRT_15092 [Giardia muris]|uniref:Uncharacterized protein n=1 Tax=Giardia muris TaxID=5742 RepID=A0A4Z1SQ07_GIAMU|nr:hypothetical protein GMRT_15092 [Giardia muris]|eukprot:TNJ26965.1 hypothetical protein GMRT_15092 [Giardia muris]